MTPPQSPPRTLPTATRYLVAVAAVVVAGLARWAMDPFWGAGQLPYTFFFLGAILVAWWVRLGPALLTMALGTLAANYLFVSPPGSWTMGAELVRVSSFLASSLAAIIAIEAIHRANAHAQSELRERRHSQEALAEAARRQDILYRFVDDVQRAKTLEAIYDRGLDTILEALRCDRASVLLFDEAGVMRFVGARGLSVPYRNAVEGHSPWTAETKDPLPLAIDDVEQAELEEHLRAALEAEGLGALAFIPLVVDNRLIGKFMAYYDQPHAWQEEELELALTMARQLAFGIARKRDERALQESEQRLEQAMVAGRMGAWQWSPHTGRVIWSPGLERIHGLEPATFGGTFEDFQRDIHPEDRSTVQAAVERAFRESGNYHISYRIRRPDGMQRWVEAFGRVTTNSKGEPEGMSGVCMDITERRQDETERERLLEREHQLRQSAEEANRVKDEFLATLSHELRNPLNAILGFSELLLRSSESEPLRSLRPIGEALKRNSLIQSNLIRDLLDLSKLRSGKIELKPETFDLEAAARNAVQAIRSEAATKNVAVRIEPPETRISAHADLLRFSQVAWNLLSNAVKFTPSGGSIVVRLAREEDKVMMTVEDTGQGIEPAFLPHIFEMFRQADGSSTREHAGMGIGLALVRQLVELQGGSVTAHSDGLGHGARFVVRLPAGAEADVPEVTGPPSDDGALLNMRVLVLDDSEDTADMLLRLLETYGVTVATAHSAPDALALAAERSWDVVLSDISMPGMDGFEFLRRLRALPGREAVPVLALTGYGQAEDVRRAEAAGFYAHMTKPVDLELLMKNLRSLPSRRAPLERPAPNPV